MKAATPRRTQPSGLPGIRQATTKPTTPKPAENQTGREPLLASRLWCARPARGTSAITNASTRPPRTSAVTGDARWRRRAPPAVVTAVCPATGSTPLTERTLRPDRSGNVTGGSGQQELSGGQGAEEPAGAGGVIAAGVLAGDEVGDAHVGQRADLRGDGVPVADEGHVGGPGGAFAVKHGPVGRQLAVDREHLGRVALGSPLQT